MSSFSATPLLIYSFSCSHTPSACLIPQLRLHPTPFQKLPPVTKNHSHTSSLALTQPLPRLHRTVYFASTIFSFCLHPHSPVKTTLGDAPSPQINNIPIHFFAYISLLSHLPLPLQRQTQNVSRKRNGSNPFSKLHFSKPFAVVRRTYNKKASLAKRPISFSKTFWQHTSQKSTPLLIQCCTIRKMFGLLAKTQACTILKSRHMPS